jgi:hypothetical protein
MSTSTSQIPGSDKATSFLDMACAEQQLHLAPTSVNSQVLSYLNSGVVLIKSNIMLLFWQNLEHSQPRLLQMVKDVSGSHLSGVGIKQKFSTARKTCNFQ